MEPRRTGKDKFIKEIISEELKHEESGQNTKNRTRNTILQFENNLELQKRVISRLEGERIGTSIRNQKEVKKELNLIKEKHLENNNIQQ